ncbi:MAG: adenine phosphoribosyltransferase [Gammaproteobacteria bacterium]|nr:adenine phosphoribosyltransferase [Gammaproteobacteria bacterium]
MEQLKHLIRDIPDFPKPGILFKDITPLLRDGAALRHAAELLVAPFLQEAISAVAGMEARGFIFGSLAAASLGCGFVPLRKPGKLPYATHRETYDLEYGSADLELHVDALTPADRVLLVDDLIATGGTAAAACRLLTACGATLVACAFVIELQGLAGRAALPGRTVHALLRY